MTIGKVLLLVAGFIGAIALGIAIGLSLTHRGAAVAPAAEISRSEATQANARRAATLRAKTTARPAAIPASTEALQTRLKPVLNRGTNMTIAAEGFRDGEQFAMVAHAARNTQVPFMLLKHRVLNERHTLSDAIRASKPDIDAASETNLARVQARSDIAAISS